MELRIYATTQDCKKHRMSKSPDLSAFPIPRKGGARPIAADEALDVEPVTPKRAGQGGQTVRVAELARCTEAPIKSAPSSRPDRPARTLQLPPMALPPPVSASAGQVVATTVKLDEGRYLRLVNAGQPGPGPLKRRTIQDMMVEAIDEWFDRREL